MRPTLDPASSSRRLFLVVASNGVLRVAGGATSVLVGLYIARLADLGLAAGAAFAGLLAAISFGVELVAAVPMGMLADAVPARTLMTGSALAAACATALFGLTAETSLLVASRALEGLAAAAGVPALLAHITDVTSRDRALRSRVMSYFELSLLAGLAVGGLLGAQLWRALDTGAFVAVAALYVLAAPMLFAGTTGSRRPSGSAWQGLRRALGQPSLRRLAPIWLIVNTVVGLWLGPTFYFLLTHRSTGPQFLAGLLADDPSRLGWVLLAYSLVFAAGLAAWSVVLPRTSSRRALRISLVAMAGVSVAFLVLNHAAAWPPSLRWSLVAAIAMLVMVESGFTPAALSLLASAVGPAAGRGAAMGVYSMLLGLGALAGSVIAAAAGERFEVDGLIIATIALAVIALTLVERLEPFTFQGEGD